MNLKDVVTALRLPNSARVDQRVPKKLLLENIAPTTSDKRLLVDTIEEIQWLAALKPNTIGVPSFRDGQREYLEIAVLAVVLRGIVKPTNLARLAELVHRAVPYPVFLLMAGNALTLSLAHKRWAQNEAGKVVLEDDPVSASLSLVTDHASEAYDATAFEIERAFVHSLSVERQPQATLYALYQGWMERVWAFQAARLTGTYQVATSPEQATARRQALAECVRLENEIGRLRALAAKEKQLVRQVEMNLTLKRIQADLAAARQQL